MIYAASAFILTYGWVISYHTNLAGPLINLFLVGHTFTGAVNCLSTLVVSCNIKSPATAQAANQLYRCLFGAGAVAAAVPLIDRIGVGWTGTCIAALGGVEVGRAVERGEKAKTREGGK